MYKDIERIMKTCKVEDGHIILNKPLVLYAYGKKIIVDQINWIRDWDKFSYKLGLFLAYYLQACQARGLPDNVDDIEKFRELLKLTIKNTVVGKKAFRSMLGMMRVCRLPIGYMKRKFTIDDWVEYFLYCYIYNVMGVKKNLINAKRLISKVRSS